MHRTLDCCEEFRFTENTSQLFLHAVFLVFVSLQITFFLWMAFSSIKEIDPSSKFQNIMIITKWKLPVQLSSVKSTQTLICEKFSGNIALMTIAEIIGPEFHSLEIWWTNHSLATKQDVFLTHIPAQCFKNALIPLFYWSGLCFWENQTNAADTIWFSSYIVVKLNQGRFTKRISWIEASGICKLINATLPIVRSRSELLEIFALIKLSPHVPDLFAIFLGMRRKHKASGDL